MRKNQRWVRVTIYIAVVLMVVGLVGSTLASAWATPAGGTNPATHAGQASGTRQASASAISERKAGRGGARSTALPAASSDRPVPIVVVVTAGWSWPRVVDQAGSSPVAQVFTGLADTAAPAMVVPRTAGAQACAADVWLTLSAGARTRAVAPALGRTPSSFQDCSWPSWSQAQRASAAAGYDAIPGALADALAATGRTTVAIGRGAQLALTTSTGKAPTTRDSVVDLLRSTANTEQVLPDLTIIDSTRRGMDLADRTFIGDLKVLASAHLHARLLIVSLADPRSQAPQAMLLPAGTTGWGVRAGSLVASPSTHQRGVIQLTDLAPSMVSALGASIPSSMSGQALTFPESGEFMDAYLTGAMGGATAVQNVSDSASPGPTSGSLTVDPATGELVPLGAVPRSATMLADSTARALASNRATLPAALVIVVAAVAVVLGSTMALRGRTGTSSGCRVPGEHNGNGDTSAPNEPTETGGTSGPAFLLPCRAAALWVGCLPVGAWLTSLVPWWRIGSHMGLPSVGTVMAGIMVMCLWATLVAGGAWLAGSLLARGWLRPIIAATLTTTVILVDGATGAPLGFNGLLGMDAVLAGRFYGVSNTAFALAGSALVVALAATAWATAIAGLSIFTSPEAGKHTGRARALWALASVRCGAFIAGITMLALAADALPITGADVGGALTLVVAMSALWLALVGARFTPLRALSVCLAALGAVAGLAAVDWMTGPRTHLGQFLADLLGGEPGRALATVGRKVGSIVAPFVHEPAALLALTGGIVAAGMVALWLRRQRQAWLADTSPYAMVLSGAAQAPWIPAALKALVVLMVVEVLVNDSGAAMAVESAAIAAPLLLASICEHCAQESQD